MIFKRKKISAFFIILFSAYISIFSEVTENSRLAFSIQPTFGCTLGQMNESIYSSKGYKCSLLEWEQKPLWNCGITTLFEAGSFGINASFDFALPLSCGKMYDSDWNESGIKTTYSIHELTAVTNLNTELSLLYAFNVNNFFQIIPSIQAHYSYNSFEANNGEGWYGGAAYSQTGKDVSWNDENAVHYKVYGIDYSRHTLYLFAGLTFQFRIINRLNIEVNTFLSPFTYTSAIDHHHGKYNDFRFQEIQYSWFSRFKISAKLSYSVTSFFDIGLYARILTGKEDIGTLYTDYWTEDLTLVDNQPSGADIRSYNFGIFTTFRVKK